MVSKAHRASHPTHDVSGVEYALTVHQGYLFVHPARTDLGSQAQAEMRSTVSGFQILESPATVGRLPVDWMSLAAEGCAVSAEWHAEEITAQRFDDRSQRRIVLLFRPWCHGIWLQSSATPIERDRPDMSAHLGDECLDIRGSDQPRRLPVNDTSCTSCLSL